MKGRVNTGDTKALRTIRANSYVTQRESGILDRVGTKRYKAFAAVFDGVPEVFAVPYRGAGSDVSGSVGVYDFVITNVNAGSFRHIGSPTGNLIKYFARYYSSGIDVAL